VIKTFDHLKPDKRSKMLTELVGCWVHDTL